MRGQRRIYRLPRQSSTLTRAQLAQDPIADRVRAIDERFYGRTARLFRVGVVNQPGDTRSAVGVNPLSVAADEAVPAHEADELRATLRHARIPAERAREFWEHVLALAQEFAKLPRSGGTVYGFARRSLPNRPSRPPRQQR